jgi:hypothetical protein
MKDKVKRVRKETVLAYEKRVFLQLAGEPEEYYEIPVRTDEDAAGNRTAYLLNARHRTYRWRQRVRHDEEVATKRNKLLIYLFMDYIMRITLAQTLQSRLI